MPGLLTGLAQVFYVSDAHAAWPPVDAKDAVKILCKVGTYMFWILIALSTVMVLAAAFMYLTAGENAEKVGKAHKTIAYAAVAIIVALLAKGFPALIAGVIGGTLPPGSTCS